MFLIVTSIGVAVGCGFLNVTMTYRLTVSKTYPHAGAIVGVWVVCMYALTQIGCCTSAYLTTPLGITLSYATNEYV